MPISLETFITVTAHFLKFDGTPAVGQVKFTPSSVIIGTSANEIVYPVDFVATLDVNGRISIALPATDDPDLTPQFTYGVTETIQGVLSSPRTYNLRLPYNTAGGTVDLADVAALGLVS